LDWLHFENTFSFTRAKFNDAIDGSKNVPGIPAARYLSQLKGKYVLLDFWGSWCKPCRESHPQLIDLYNQFHSMDFKDGSGFEIVSFGVERNPGSWQNAIKDDKLDWPYHLVSTNLFDNPTVEAYKVKQIPTRFLINPEGTIIAIDPTFNAISALLQKRLMKATSK